MGRPVSTHRVGPFFRGVRRPGAAGHRKRRATWPPCPDPEPGRAPPPPHLPGQPTLSEQESNPGSLNHLPSSRGCGGGVLPPQPPRGANSGRGLINHTEILATWLCSFAFTIRGDKLHAALASLGWSWRGGRGGPLVPEKPASCWAWCEGSGGRHNAAVVGLISNCGLLVWL